MKLLFVGVFFCLHLASATALFRPKDEKTPRSSLTGGRTSLPQTSGLWIKDTHRPLFARRKLYERQKVTMQKPKKAPVPPKVPLPSPDHKVEEHSRESSCSQLTQSCLPQFGCCDPQALCHCRFFNAICFCRKFSRGP